jgi:hypothetical protein
LSATTAASGHTAIFHCVAEFSRYRSIATSISRTDQVNL